MTPMVQYEPREELRLERLDPEPERLEAPWWWPWWWRPQDGWRPWWQWEQSGMRSAARSGAVGAALVDWPWLLALGERGANTCERALEIARDPICIEVQDAVAEVALRVEDFLDRASSENALGPVLKLLGRGGVDAGKQPLREVPESGADLLGQELPLAF